MPQNLDIHQPDDRFFREAMSDPEVVKAYLQHFYPKIAAIADPRHIIHDKTGSHEYFGANFGERPKRRAGKRHGQGGIQK